MLTPHNQRGYARPPRGQPQWQNEGEHMHYPGQDEYRHPQQVPSYQTRLPLHQPVGTHTHDMNKPPFTSQQGMQGPVPGQQQQQQGMHPGAGGGGQPLVSSYPQQQMVRHQGASQAGGQQPPQAFYRQNQSGPRMSGMQGPRGVNMMQQQANAQGQQSYYPPMFQIPQMQQTAHLMAYQGHSQPMHGGAVEFPPSSDAVAGPLLQPHPSPSQYTLENGDIVSSGMQYRYSNPQYSQPSQPVYHVPGGYQALQYYPSQMVIHGNRPHVGQMGGVQQQQHQQQQQQQQPQAPPPKREKKLIQIVDPSTLLDITKELLTPASTNNDTPPGSTASSARNTPPAQQEGSNNVAAEFARKVAAVASSTGPTASEIAKEQQQQARVSATLTAQAAAAGTNISEGADTASSTLSDPASRKPGTVESKDAAVLENSATNEKHTEQAGADARVVTNGRLTSPVRQPQQHHTVPAAKVDASGIETGKTVDAPRPFVVAETTVATDAVTFGGPPPQPAAILKKSDGMPPPPFPVAVKSEPATHHEAGHHQFGAASVVSAQIFVPAAMAAAAAAAATPAASAAAAVSAPVPSQIASTPPGHASVPPGIAKLPAPQSSGPPFTSAPIPVQTQVPIRILQAPVQAPVVAAVAATVVPAVVPPPSSAPIIPVVPAVSSPAAQPTAATQHKQNGEVTDGSLSDEGKDTKNKQKGRKKGKEANKKGDLKEERTMEVVVAKESIQAAVPVEAPTVLAKTVVSETEVKVESSEPQTVTPALIPAAVTTTSVDEELQAEEEQRKVAVKNEENNKVSKGLIEAVTEVAAVIVQPAEVSGPPTPTDSQVSQLKYDYKEDQWSPVNLEGKKQYDRDFLLRMQTIPMSQQKPTGLPDLEVIKDVAIKPVRFEGMPPRGGSMGMNGGGMKRPGLGGPDFTPAFVSVAASGRGGGHHQGTPMKGRMSQQGGRNKDQMQMQQQMQVPPKKVLSLSLNQDIKLHVSSDAWKPTHKVAKEVESDEGNELLNKRVRALLNKLTPQNFAKIMDQVSSFDINTEERLTVVINLVFEKAIDEPNFSVAYASMCKHLSSLRVMNANKEPVQFKKLIITRCQREFEKDGNDECMKDVRLEKIQEATTEEKRKELQDELDDAERRSKMRSLGNIRFIGELFKLTMLTPPIMHDCLNKLSHAGDEDSIECLCRLLSTIGKDLDRTTAKPPVKPNQRTPPSPMDLYFNSMKALAESGKVTSRVKFMLLDVIDLRKRNWIPRRDENKPKTLDQIHKDAENEAMDRQAQLSNPGPSMKRMDERDMRRGGGGGMGGGGGGGGGGRERRNNDDGWNMVATPTRKAPMLVLDPSKTRMTKPSDIDDFQLGNKGSFRWGTLGSSGGAKLTAQEKSEPEKPSNRYSALSDHSSFGSRSSNQGRSNNLPTGRDSSRNRMQAAAAPSVSQKKNDPLTERNSAIMEVKRLRGSEEPSKPIGGASRDSSVTRATVAGPVVAFDENKVRSILEEFVHNTDFEEAIACVKDTCASSNMATFINVAINTVLERSEQSRNHVGQLLSQLVKQSIATTEQFFEGFKEVLASADDFEIDVPKFWEYVSEILCPIWEVGVLPLGQIKVVTNFLSEKRHVAKLFAKVMNVMQKKVGAPKMKEIWASSGLDASFFLPPGTDVDKFISLNKLEFLQVGKESDNSISANAVEKDLTFQLQSVKVDSEGLFDWINGHIALNQRKEPQFIRALVTAIASTVINRDAKGDYILDTSLFESYCNVIKRYVDTQEQLELAALLALQVLWLRLQHPKNILTQLFHVLSDLEVISVDAFQNWQSLEAPNQMEGHAVAVKAVNPFLENLALDESNE